MLWSQIIPENIVGSVISTGMLVAVVGYLFKLLWDTKQKEHDRALAELEAVKKSYAEIAAEALKSAVATTNHYRQKYEGKPPVLPVAPVIPESNSPSTQLQRELADVQTMRAAMANLKLITGQPAKETPPEGDEGGKLSHSVSVSEAIGLKEQIASVPEKTAEKVVEKIKEDQSASSPESVTPPAPAADPSPPSQE